MIFIALCIYFHPINFNIVHKHDFLDLCEQKYYKKDQITEILRNKIYKSPAIGTRAVCEIVVDGHIGTIVGDCDHLVDRL